MKKIIFTALAVAPLTACDNANLNVQLSHATDESSKHEGKIIYAGIGFTLVKVEIDGVDYIANSKGGIVKTGH